MRWHWEGEGVVAMGNGRMDGRALRFALLRKQEPIEAVTSLNPMGPCFRRGAGRECPIFVVPAKAGTQGGGAQSPAAPGCLPAQA